VATIRITSSADYRSVSYLKIICRDYLAFVVIRMDEDKN